MRNFTVIPHIEVCLDNDEGRGDYVCPLHPTTLFLTVTNGTKWEELGKCCSGTHGDYIGGGWHEIIRKEYCKAGDHYVLLVFGSYGG